MIYNNQPLDQKKIPTPLAIVALLLLVLVVPFVYKKPLKTSTQAQKIQYSQLKISNLTYQSATINFQTPDKQQAWILYGEQSTKLDRSAFDERDISDKKGSYTNHYISLSELAPNKRYFYQIITPKGPVSDNPFSFMTASQQNLTNNQPPSFGKVLNANGSPAQAIIFFDVDDTLPLSTRTKETSGEFLVPTYYLLTQSKELYTPKPDSVVHINIIDESGLSSSVTTRFDKIGPLDQTIILGKNYDFTKPEEKVLSETTKAQTTLNNIDIVFPENNATIPGNKPLYKGVGIPGNKVVITLKPSIYSLQTDIGKDGIWKASSDTPLPPGTYTMQLKTNDKNNKEQTLTRTFTIAKSGEAVLGEATASATLTPTQTVTSVPTPTMAISTPTTIPTEVAVTLSPTLPETGIGYMGFTLASVALIVIGAGIILLF
jgi:hypothetical protein